MPNFKIKMFGCLKESKFFVKKKKKNLKISQFKSSKNSWFYYI